MLLFLCSCNNPKNTDIVIDAVEDAVIEIQDSVGLVELKTTFSSNIVFTTFSNTIVEL